MSWLVRWNSTISVEECTLTGLPLLHWPSITLDGWPQVLEPIHLYYLYFILTSNSLLFTYICHFPPADLHSASSRTQTTSPGFQMLPILTADHKVICFFITLFYDIEATMTQRLQHKVIFCPIWSNYTKQWPQWWKLHKLFTVSSSSFTLNTWWMSLHCVDVTGYWLSSVVQNHTMKKWQLILIIHLLFIETNVIKNVCMGCV